MDELLSLLSKSLLSKDTVSTASKAAGTTTDQTSNAISSVLPQLVKAVTTTNTTEKDAKGLDSSALLKSLLGSNLTSILNIGAKAAGITTAQVNSILTAVLPMLLKQASSLNLSSIASTLLGASSTSTTADKDDKKSDTDALAALASSVLSGLASGKKK